MSGAVSVVRGAIDPLLAYLSSAIRDEAQLLGGVRRDAQFIKDEMESMNGFLHHLAEAGNDNEGDHQVRAWMKQVRDLAYDTQDCVDLYARRVGPAPPVRGVWGQLRRGLFFLQTIPARHQVATQIRELKSRARDIGERRLRYGVMVPAKETHEFAGRSSGGDAMVDEAHAHRRSLVVVEPDILKAGTVVLVNWLKKLQAEEPVGQDDPSARRPVVIAVVAPDAADGADLAKEVYEHSSVASMFDCKAWVCIQRPPFLWQVLDDMIHKLPRAQHEAHQGGASDAEDNIELQKRLKGRRFLVVIEEADHPYPWDKMKEILDSSGCSPGSVIMLTTKDSGLAEHCSPSKTRVHSLVQFCFEKADQLIPTEYEDDHKRVLIRRIMKKCDPDVFCMKLLLGTLYADPHMSKKQLEDLCTSLESSGQPPDDSDTSKQHIRLKMMKFCYDKLPKMDRSCLLYLSIYPPNMKIRRTSLVRRWVAEGHVTEGDGQEALDRAEGCFDDLVAQGFVDIAKAGNLGNVVSCKVQDIVRDFIVKIVRDENFGDASLPPKLARHLSISSDIQWHQVLHKLKQKQQQGSGYICNCFSTVGPPEAEGAPESDEVTTFLESLPAFSGVAARVKVMDLDFCRHLKNMHLKIICNNLFMLKYLSIVSTEISGLPSREINKLQQLETLDIRQTKVPSSATKDLFLPMLKHLLAGPVGYQVGVSPEETLSTVLMPNKIGRMTKMETLIYVEVAEDDKELKNVKNLKCLKSLGVVIHGKQDNVNHLLRVVTELSEHLRKLSVWVRPPRQTSNAEGLNMNLELTQSFPKFLEILRINGITKGLPNWIEDDSDENSQPEATRKAKPLSDGNGGMDTVAGLLASLMEVVRTTVACECVYVRAMVIKALIWMQNPHESLDELKSIIACELSDPAWPSSLLNDVLLTLHARFKATPDMAVTLLEIARIFATKVPGKIDADVLQLLWKTCLVGAGPDGKHTALEAVTIVLDLPPPQPGSMSVLTSVDMISASDPKSAMALQRLVQAAVWFLGENANYAASEYAWESATPPGTALMMLDADKMVAAASSRNPTLASALTRLQRCAFSGSWEIRIAAVQALTTIAIRSGEPYRLQIYEFLHALSLGGVQSNFSELQLSNGENQGASGTGLGSLINPMLKVLDEMYKAQDDLARDIRQHDNSKQEWSDDELKKLYETHERLLDFVCLFCFVPRIKYLPLGPTSAKLIEIYRNRHNISASVGLSDPAVATGISDLMYESKEVHKETSTMQSGIDPDLAMAWAAGLEDDAWANDAPAVDKVKDFLSGAGTDAPDVDDEDYMNSRPSVGYDDMWAKTILEEEDDGRSSGGSSPDSTGSVETSISSHFGGMNYPSLFSSKPPSYGASQQTIREEPPSYSTSVLQKRESFDNPLAGRGGRSSGSGSHEDVDKSSGNPQSGKALYDFTAGGDDELSLNSGEDVDIEYEVDGWYYVKKKRPGRDGKMAGLVPVLYVSS